MNNIKINPDHYWIDGVSGSKTRSSWITGVIEHKITIAKNCDFYHKISNLQKISLTLNDVDYIGVPIIMNENGDLELLLDDASDSQGVLND